MSVQSEGRVFTALLTAVEWDLSTRHAGGSTTRKSLLTLALAVFGACGENSGPAIGDVVVRDSAGFRIVENTVAHDTCSVSTNPLLDIGQVDGPEEFQFFRVFDAATLSDGRIAVLNQGSSQIRLFLPDGTFDSAFGSEGDGPGEFRRLFQLWVMPGDTIVAGDYRPWRFSYFLPDGTYLGTAAPEPPLGNVPAAAGIMADGSSIVAVRDHAMPVQEPDVEPQVLTVAHFARDGSLIDTLAALPNGTMAWLVRDIGFLGDPVFEAKSRVVAEKDRVVVGLGTERQIVIHEYARPSALTPPTTDPVAQSPRVTLARWTGPDRTVTAADVDAYREWERERWGGMSPGPDPRVIDALVSDDRPVAERFPAHAAIMLGTEGDVWVHTYRRPTAGDADWLVFGTDGRLQCRAAVELDDIYEIGPDYILGKRTDDLDVEHVVRFGLERPSSPR